MLGMLLRDDKSVRVEKLLQGKAGDRSRSGVNNRLFVGAVCGGRGQAGDGAMCPQSLALGTAPMFVSPAVTCYPI